MSKILDAIREKHPGVYDDWDDDDLAFAIGEKYPDYLKQTAEQGGELEDPDFIKRHDLQAQARQAQAGTLDVAEGGLGTQIGIGAQQVLPGASQAIYSLGEMALTPTTVIPDEDAEKLREAGIEIPGISKKVTPIDLLRFGNPLTSPILAGEALLKRQLPEKMQEQLETSKEEANEKARQFMRTRAVVSGDLVRDLEKRGQMTEGPDFARKVTRTAGESMLAAGAGGPGGIMGMTVAAGLHSAGGNYQEHRMAWIEQGLDNEQAAQMALKQSALDGVITGTVTRLFGPTGVEAFGKEWIKQPIKNIVKDLNEQALRPRIKRAVTEMTKQMLLEAPEEMTDQMAQEVLAMLTSNPEMTMEDAIKSTLEAGAMAPFAAGVALTPQTAGEIGEAIMQEPGRKKALQQERAQAVAPVVQQPETEMDEFTRMALKENPQLARALQEGPAVDQLKPGRLTPEEQEILKMLPEEPGKREPKSAVGTGAAVQRYVRKKAELDKKKAVTEPVESIAQQREKQVLDRKTRRDLEKSASDAIWEIENPDQRKAAQQKLDRLKKDRQAIQRELEEATTTGERISAVDDLLENQNQMRKLAGQPEEPIAGREEMEPRPLTPEEEAANNRVQGIRVMEKFGLVPPDRESEPSVFKTKKKTLIRFEDPLTDSSFNITPQMTDKQIEDKLEASRQNFAEGGPYEERGTGRKYFLEKKDGKWRRRFEGEEAAPEAPEDAEQTAITQRLKKEKTAEQQRAFEAKYQRLMKDPKEADDMAPEEAREHLDRLLAAPGTNPEAEKALKARIPEQMTVDQWEEWIVDQFIEDTGTEDYVAPDEPGTGGRALYGLGAVAYWAKKAGKPVGKEALAELERQVENNKKGINEDEQRDLDALAEAKVTPEQVVPNETWQKIEAAYTQEEKKVTRPWKSPDGMRATSSILSGPTFYRGTTWKMTPIEEWGRDTYTYDRLTRLWDSGAMERGNVTGLVVTHRKKKYVLSDRKEYYRLLTDKAREQVGVKPPTGKDPLAGTGLNQDTLGEILGMIKRSDSPAGRNRMVNQLKAVMDRSPAARDYIMAEAKKAGVTLETKEAKPKAPEVETAREDAQAFSEAKKAVAKKAINVEVTEQGTYKSKKVKMKGPEAVEVLTRLRDARNELRKIKDCLKKR